MLALCVSVGVMGCGGGAGDGGIPTLDVAGAIDNPRVTDLAELAESIEFIPLDAPSPDALVGEIYIMAESKSGFYITDLTNYPNNAVRFFDRAGRFVAVKGSIGRGPEEYMGVSHMTVDHDGDVVYVSSGAGFVAYDAEGRMVARNDSIRGSQAEFFDNRLIHINYPSGAPDEGERFTLIDIFADDLRPEGKIEVPSKGTVAFPIGFQAMTSNGKDLSIKEELSDTVFYYRNGGRLEPAFTMGMGRYAFPREMFDFALAERWDEFYRVIYIYKGDRQIVAKLQNGLNGDICYAVLGRGEGGFMAVGEDGEVGLFLDGVRFTPMYVRDNRLVGYFQALDVVDNAAGITNSSLRALAGTLREDSNPVIVVVELK